MRMRHGRLRPLLILLVLLVLAWALGLFRYVSLAELEQHRRALAGFVADRPWTAGLLYVLAHAGIVALVIPVGPVLTMAGGFLFGRWLGLLLAVPAATLGASILFLAVRHALAQGTAQHAGPMLDRVRAGLKRDGFWYLLSIRLLPVIPYSVGSIAPALVGMRLRVFVAATAIGIIPGTAIFAGIGAGLDDIFARGDRPDLRVMLAPPTLFALLALAGLSLSAVWWRRRAS
ncbi:TVP38/TMEM64 family protein [Roseomonas hellenica]|nr:TVP38/TMEM64 family protein [Plastoroseomonas hellenica]